MIEIVKSVFFVQEMLVRHHFFVFLSFIVKKTIKNCHIDVRKQLIMTSQTWISSPVVTVCLTALFRFSPDVHGVHPHGAPGQEAEPEPSRARARAGEKHGQHQRAEGPRPPQEREEVLLRADATWKNITWRRRRRLDTWRDLTICCTAEGYECNPGQEKDPFKDSPGGLNQLLQSSLLTLRRWWCRSWEDERWIRPSCQNQV